MKYAVKNKRAVVTAYPLGAGHPMELALLEEGAIRLRGDGSYELFSQEAAGGCGQIAQAGDYFKVDTIDGRHFPYPNSRDYFLENHTPLGGDTYEQRPKPLLIWQAGDAVSEEVRWLADNGRLTLKPEDPAHYFNAFLWGADLSAAMDATLVFYSVDRDAAGPSPTSASILWPGPNLKTPTPCCKKLTASGFRRRFFCPLQAHHFFAIINKINSGRYP